MNVIDKTLLNNKKIILKQMTTKSTLYEIEHLKEVLNFHKRLARTILNIIKFI